MHPFIVDEEYARPALLTFVGSKQRQSGVIWGLSEPGCLICTTGGRPGRTAGYSDSALGGGGWQYFGQGRSGHQTLGNAANSKLASGKFSVLLFSTREPTAREIAARRNYRKLFAFRGHFNVAAIETVVPADGPRKGDRLYKFSLVPIEEFTFVDATLDDPGEKENLLQLRQELYACPHVPPRSSFALAQYRLRSVHLRRYSLLRASGKCESCRQDAPFRDFRGHSFLEIHHIFRLADGGPDRPENVIALCPNCHRRAHFSFDRVEFSRALVKTVLLVENEFGHPMGGGR